MLEKWLEKNIFGLDVEFVQDILKQLCVQDTFEFELFSIVEIICSHQQRWKMVT